MEYIFGLGREGCADCWTSKGAHPLCTMNCSGRIGADGVTCPECGYPAIDCNQRTINRLEHESNLRRQGVTGLEARRIAERRWPPLPAEPGEV